MPTPNAWVRAQMLFQLPDGEVASTGWSLNPGPGFVTLTQADVDAIEARASAFWTAAKARHATATSYLGVKAALIGQDDKTISTLEKAVTAVPGTSSGQQLPTEVAVCVSLRTAFAGRSQRGRMFMPAPGHLSLTSTGRLNSGAAAAYAADVDALLQPLTVGSKSFTACVASKTANGLYPITSIRVGDVFDVQRRRRDNISEVYTVVPL